MWDHFIERTGIRTEEQLNELKEEQKFGQFIR
jgi:hypothetical protein